MNTLQIEVDQDQTLFKPGDTIRGDVRWNLQDTVDQLELRLFWTTQGIGTTALEIMNTQVIDRPSLVGEDKFEFPLPLGPYSFSGKHISVRWLLEFMTPKGKDAVQYPFVLSPLQREVLLYPQHSGASA